MCLEHNVDASGIGATETEETGRASFFEAHSGAKYVPRAVFVDLEPDPIDYIRLGSHRKLFHPNSFVSSKESSGGTFARAKCGRTATELLGVTLERIRKFAENCDKLEGFVIHHSASGGTGSGFTAALVDKLDNDYRNKPKLAFSVYSEGARSEPVVAPYNELLCVAATQKCETVFCLGGQTARAQSHRLLRKKGEDQTEEHTPSFRNVDCLLAQTVSTVTMPMRSGTNVTMNWNITEYSSMLIPYHQIPFLVTSTAWSSRRSRNHGDGGGGGGDAIGDARGKGVVCSFDACKLAKQTLDPRCNLLGVDIRNHSAMSGMMLFRGMNMTYTTLQKAIGGIRGVKDGQVEFVDWAPCSLRASSLKLPPTVLPESGLAPSTDLSCTFFGNSTAIHSHFRSIEQQVLPMWSKRSHVHWYTREGLEEMEFFDALQIVDNLQQDYEDVERDVSSEEANDY